MTITDLIAEAHATATDKGWWDGATPRSIGELLMLAVCELAEAMEEFRRVGPDRLREVWAVNGKPEGFAVELADVVIRLADLCGHLGIDLEEALRLKLDFNRTRPHRHGGKYA